jgi:nicotinamide mononucleotide (NMN) deamidase PncC
MINLEDAVIRKLHATQNTVCVVESCTGGLVSHLLTNVAGASEVYWGSFVAYDNSAKVELGVPHELISQKGAVSADVALYLANKGLEKMRDNPSRPNSLSLIPSKGLLCIAITGIAGPKGGTPHKPIGLCFIALAKTGSDPIVEKVLLIDPKDRVHAKNQFAQKALELILKSI